MANLKIFIVAMAATLVRSEPPVQGYQPYNYHAAPPGNQQNGYLPPQPSYTQSGSNGYNSGQGYDSGHGYNPSGYGQNGHDDYDAHNHGHGHDSEVPKSYEFGYTVKDAQSGNDYGRQETSDGNTVRGEYRVQLPDGRTQIVTYHADWKTGFHADVRYEGEARYPDARPNNYGHQQNGYNYNTPEYSGSLSGFQGNNNNYRPSNTYGTPSYH